MVEKLEEKPDGYRDALPNEQFRKKRLEWLSCLNGDDIHAIWRQETSLLWDLALFLTIKELRKDAAQNPKKEVGFNEPVFRLLEAGFAATQAVGIRRLTEKQSSNELRRVNSLKALIDDIRANRELLTREAYLVCRDLPYDPAPIKDKFYESLIASGQFNSYIGLDRAWRTLGLNQKEFINSLTSFLKPDARPKILSH